MEQETRNKNSRVKELRKFLGFTQQDFADILALKSGNTFSMIERYESNLTDRNIDIICTPGKLVEGKTVNRYWLLHGKGEMFQGFGSPVDERLEKLKADEKELVELYDKLDSESKSDIVKYTRDKLELQELRKAEKGESPASGE